MTFPTTKDLKEALGDAPYASCGVDVYGKYIDLVVTTKCGVTLDATLTPTLISEVAMRTLFEMYARAFRVHLKCIAEEK